jgi:hypothetical protein
VNREERIGRNDMHMVGLHRLSGGGERHDHRGFLRQNLGEQAFVRRIQVLNHDEGHAGCGKGSEKLNQRFEASGGGANSHNERKRAATSFWHSVSIDFTSWPCSRKVRLRKWTPAHASIPIKQICMLAVKDDELLLGETLPQQDLARCVESYRVKRRLARSMPTE